MTSILICWCCTVTVWILVACIEALFLLTSRLLPSSFRKLALNPESAIYFSICCCSESRYQGYHHRAEKYEIRVGARLQEIGGRHSILHWYHSILEQISDLFFEWFRIHVILHYTNLDHNWSHFQKLQIQILFWFSIRLTASVCCLLLFERFVLRLQHGQWFR